MNRSNGLVEEIVLDLSGRPPSSDEIGRSRPSPEAAQLRRAARRTGGGQVKRFKSEPLGLEIDFYAPAPPDSRGGDFLEGVAFALAAPGKDAGGPMVDGVEVVASMIRSIDQVRRMRYTWHQSTLTRYRLRLWVLSSTERAAVVE